jgi:FAD:protein FMN transferase
MVLLQGCAGLRTAPQRFEYRQIHMGVEARIVLHAPDSVRAITAARAAFHRLSELDAIMSDYRDDSELMRLTRHDTGSWIPVSTPLWQVLSQAQELARASGGAFDVTAGPLVVLWRAARQSGRLPSPQALEAARARSGWKLLQLDSASRSVRLTRPQMRLDLGGIAKGFAVDEALAVLGEHGAPRALVELGGDIAVGEPPPGSSGWTVRLDEPADAPHAVDLADAAISTSGDAAQFVVIDGLRYSHLIDPRTGHALTDRIAATVIARSARLSDPLATVLAVLGPEEGPRFAAEHFPEAAVYIRRLEEPR